MSVTRSDRTLPGKDVGIAVLVMKAQLRWIRHVIRMDGMRLPKTIFFSELASGNRNSDSPVKRFRDCLKSSLKACGINPIGWDRS
jgi:hypothetical protein